MFDLTDDLWDVIAPTFAAAFPREGIVAVWPDGTWEELENVHPQPHEAFCLGEADEARLLDREPALFLHSHPNGQAWPSDRDTENQIATGWTWGVVAVDGNPAGHVYQVHRPNVWGPEAPQSPLEGREYLWGVRDCWTVCRDWYASEGRDLPAIPRVRHPGPHHTDPRKTSPFAYWPPRLGFQPVPRGDRRRGDLAVLQWSSPIPNHVAVYLGEGRYLHQPERGLSAVWQVPHEERWMERFAAQFWRLP